MVEEWKQIEGYGGNYYISNMGRVSKEGTIKKPTLKPNGYMVVSLRHGTPNTKLVHRLVLETFIGYSDLEVNHINEIKHDNRLVNLEYLSSKDNCNHGTRNKRISDAHMIGIHCITNDTYYSSTKEAAHILGLHASNITEVLKGRRKHTGGFNFEYTAI